MDVEHLNKQISSLNDDLSHMPHMHCVFIDAIDFGHTEQSSRESKLALSVVDAHLDDLIYHFGYKLSNENDRLIYEFFMKNVISVCWRSPVAVTLF